jgi:hypothetical protein
MNVGRDLKMDWQREAQLLRSELAAARAAAEHEAHRAALAEKSCQDAWSFVKVIFRGRSPDLR